MKTRRTDESANLAQYQLRSSISICLIFLFAIAIPAQAQDATRERLEREAAEQAAQADRLFKEGKFKPALTLYRAERISRKTLGDVRYETLALRGIGICLAELGELDEAVTILIEARDLDSKREDKGFEGYDGLLIARAELRRGEAEAAVKALERALPKLDQAIDRDHECEARICLAAAQLRLNQPAKAEPESTRALALAEEIGTPALLAEAWLSSAEVAQAMGKLSLAYERFDDARVAFREAKQPVREIDAALNLAELCYRLGRPERAVIRYEAAIGSLKTRGDRAKEGQARLDLASIHFDLKRSQAAIDQAELARELFVELDDQPSEIAAMIIVAQARATTREGLPAAVDLVADAVGKSLQAHRDEPAESIRLMLLASELERRLGRNDRADEHLNQAEALAKKSADPAMQDAVARARAKREP